VCGSVPSHHTMLNQLIAVLRKINILPTKSRLTPMLGRWCILNKEFNNRKIDMANIDNCGVCHYDYKKESRIQPPKEVAANSLLK